MQGRAIAKNVGMSARKMRLVIDQLRHQDVNAAYSILQFSKKSASEPVGKTLRSAVANAQFKAQEQNELLDADDLVIAEIYVDEGPTMKRIRARAKGRAARILKRTSHITVTVADE